jgi:5-methyltetrahydrofolate--homocysteine methyltransferase
MTIIEEIIEAIEKGKSKRVKELIEEAIEEGIAPERILSQGLVPAMAGVSEKFSCEQFFVPEVILSARAMNVGTTILEEYMAHEIRKPLGVVVIGTVKGDLHNIGKNLVAMMLRGLGFLVHDLGYDVEVDTFVEKAVEYQADIICMSAMLTTTMSEMKKVVGKLVNKKLRHRFIIMVGGAPVSEAFASSIGADIYTKDAGSAAKMAKEAMLARKKETV